MRLNHVTVLAPDLDAAWDFYGALGLQPIIDHRPNYIRFRCADGDATLSVDLGQP
jgi:catechol 2,3-dioxygenase-like lactoylglutathione lyase family enzyme